MELVRYFDPQRTEGGEFGDGWRLLIPYRIAPAGDAARPFLNVVIPSKMSVRNLLTSETEVLTFSEDRYGLAGYVPDRTETSEVIGLFLMSDASYRLADKLGNQEVTFLYTLDPAGGYVVASAHLSTGQSDQPMTCVVRYEYDKHGRLARAEKPLMAQAVPGVSRN